MSRRASSAPIPYGPPSLCAVKIIRSRPLAAKSTGRSTTACTASLCEITPRSRASAAIPVTGCTVPTSLLAHITDTTAVVSVTASASLGRSIRPNRSTGINSTLAASSWASQPTESSTAGCSMVEVTMPTRPVDGP